MAQELLNKYIWLADTIYRAGKINLKDINTKWLRSSLSNKKPLTRRTFHNHRIAIEQMFDMNIACNPITNEYYIENLEDYGGNNLTNWLLNSFSISNIIRESNEIHERIVLDNIPSAQSYLTEFISAMQENIVVQMVYHPFWSEQALDIVLYPYFVKLFNKRWYVYGRTDNDEIIKVYALDRVKSLLLTSTKFNLPTEFSPSEHLYNSIGIMKTETEKPCEIIIKTYGDTSKYMRALPLHHSQKEIEHTNDYSLFKYRLSPTEDFYQEILRKREYIEVVSPQFVRDKMVEIISRLSNYYL